jgi:hypothetical protein
MDGQKRRRVENRDARKVRISQRLEDKPKIGLYYFEAECAHLYKWKISVRNCQGIEILER